MTTIHGPEYALTQLMNSLGADVLEFPGLMFYWNILGLYCSGN